MRAGDPRRPRSGAPRPGQDAAVRLRGIRRGKHERLVVFRLAQLAQPLDSAGQRELRAAEALDEVAAPAGADGLERPQLPVDRAVAAGNPFSADAVARDDPLPLEQELCERAPACDRLAGEQPRRE